MASTQAKVDAVKAAVPSTTSCTPATVVTLKELLLPDDPTKTKPAVRTAKASATTRTKPAAAPKKPTSAGETLSARDRTVLATHVINASLKSLAEAAKPPPPSTPSKPNGAVKQPTGTRALRRSISAPLSPLQPRTLNRVASSPNVRAKDSKPLPAAQSTGCLATVECARIAFACLRSLKGPAQEGQGDYQLENGMSALVGRLLALGLHDQAIKDLRVLKKRLDGSASTSVPKNAKTAAADSSTAANGIADLLDFGKTVTKQGLPAITACQMQTLRLVAATKKPAHIESLLPALRVSNPSSPVNLLSRLAEAGDKEASKAARQMATLSQIILSSMPNVSASEDAVATEPRLSPSPTVVFELQALAFRTQLTWWKLAGHQGNVDDDVLSPLTRCMRAFVRRQKSDEKLVYQTLSSTFEEMMQLIRSHKHQPAATDKSPLSVIYQVLGSAAHSARKFDEAYGWLQSLKSCLDSEAEGSVRACSVSARILAAALRRSTLGSDVEELTKGVIAGLEGSLSGTVTELNELLESLSAARRSVVGLLKNVLEPASASQLVPDELAAAAKDFVVRFPKFVRRWLGSPPGKDAGAKQVLQFDQRKQTITQSIGQILDAALMVLKCDIQAGSSDWQLMDDVLQHCASLLESISDPAMSIARAEQLGTYHVKISSLYFSKFLEVRKTPNRTKDVTRRLLQALSRSIDAVKDRSLAEKEKAQLSTKLELFADLCKEAGRAEDAVRTLRSICTNMAEDGVLSEVATALATQPPALAWSKTDKASSLSRTLRSIAKLDRSWNDWTFFLPETERAAVLEHLLHLSSSGSTHFQPPRLHDPSLTALLRIYTPEKYPIRRARVLLHVFYQNIGVEAGVQELSPQLDMAMEQLTRQGQAEDSSLGKYISHLEAYYASISAMSDSEAEMPLSPVRDAVSSWSRMAAACKVRDDLYEVIDDPEGLVEHLQSLAQLAGLRGDNKLQLSISELSIALAKAIDAGASTEAATRDSLVLSHSQLAARYVDIGSYTQALKTIEQTRALVEQNEGISRGIMADFYLSQAEYYSGVGGFEEALKYISKASDICSQSYSSWSQSRSQATVMLSMTFFLQSTVFLQKGDVLDALTAVKSSVRMLSHDWSKLEAELSANGTASSADSSVAETSTASIELKPSQARAAGPRFWRLASPLVRSLLHISSVYAHIGMFQETVYYAESARKIADSTQSPLFKAQVSAWTASVYVKAGMLDKALAACEEAATNMPEDACSCRVRVSRQIGDVYSATGDGETAQKYLKIAEDTVHLLSNSIESTIPVASESSVSAVTAKSKTATVTKTTRATRAARTAKAAPTPAPRVVKRGRAATRAKTPPAQLLPELPKDVYQSSMLAAVILSRAVGLIHREDWSSALSTLEQVKVLPKLLGTLSQEHVVMATTLIGHSMEQMISDPVFSVVQDSTISFPAVCGALDKGAVEKAVTSTSPVRKGRTDRRGGKDASGPAFAEALRRAQELLIEAHGSALSASDSSTVHRISTLLQSTIILLSATSAAKGRPAVTSGLATVAVDFGRNIAWAREQNTLRAPANASATTIPTKSASPTSANRRYSLDIGTDPAKFQKKYVEMIPKNWSVISLSLSDNRHDLCISKLQAGHSPFILRLPLERANCRDADSEIFNFEHGREELHAVIKLANETSHSARDLKAKGERSAWWTEREALDARLGELLTTVETTWLGGFRGIFSQHERRPDLLARFQKSFQQILDGSLPSRNRIRGKKTTKASGVTLDPRILDLFIGLGDPTDPDADYDEALNDLLYFVVDILQFHGEHNAYDEIDFDAMVVETYDALRGYYSAARGVREEGAHTVLVLDKALHEFPWESLPCMEGLAVSRVPSLACLRQLIMNASMPGETEVATNNAAVPPKGHYVSVASGTFVLNPSSDLKNTQSFFQNTFNEKLDSWTGIVNREPQEAEMERALSDSDIMLYFGHGSGAQYIRGRTVRRLERCRPATFLMGCSSAALTAVGEFECYGPVWNYMMAGCPAVVGTLWDVTDRDIDRFAGRAFEEWGLLPKGTFASSSTAKSNRARGRGRANSPVDEETDREERDSGAEEKAPYRALSLAEAVGKAREACRFRYLNAAAVVVYGIPAYISRDDGKCTG